MARVFLDTNIFIDAVEDRDGLLLEKLAAHALYVSVLSISTWVYIYKHSVPNSKFEFLFDTYNFINVTSETAQKSALGPTNDFEDNVQLHSASDANCDTFITKDAKLLKLGYFGKVRISDSFSNKNRASGTFEE